MADEEKCKVLFVDDDPRVGADWKEVLEPKGYEVIIAKGEGQSLIDNARTLAWEEYPHIIIIDLRLRQEEPDDRQGLELLEDFKAPCIIYSAYLDDANLLRQVIEEHDQRIWVKKTDAPRQLLKDIEKLAASSCQAKRVLAINRLREYHSDAIIQTLFPDRGTIPPRLVDDLLCQLFPEESQLSLLRIDNQVRTPRTVSRGRSVVLRVQPRRMEPVVVKLAAAEDIERERSQYKKHIEHQLGGHFYADLIDTCYFWGLGAACYTFLSTPMRSLKLFSALYQEQGDATYLLQPLEFFFTQVWRHYHRSQSLLPTASLFAEYDDKLHLREHFQSLDTDSEFHNFDGIPDLFPNPVRWVLSRKDQSVLPNVEAAIVHGDLHSDNLFVDGEKAWAIDFERTEFSHKLRDFAELEVDLLTRLVRMDKDDLSFYRLALTVAHHPQNFHYNAQQLESSFPLVERWQPSNEMQKALSVLAGIRRLAYRVYPYETPEEYLWSVLLTSLFAASLHPEGNPQREQALLLAAVICQRLKVGSQVWHTDMWPELEQ